jgi:hypothetical protein
MYDSDSYDTDSFDSDSYDFEISFVIATLPKMQVSVFIIPKYQVCVSIE